MNIEVLGTSHTIWEIGPYHGTLPGNFKLRLRLDGEIVVGAETETGFQHRGLEKAMEGQRWHGTIPYADRLDPEGAIHGELALCLAAEEIGGFVVPERARMIRIIVAELARISCHFGYIARMARIVGSDTMFHYVLRDRERLLDLFELLTGARFAMNFLRFGGVASDVTDGFIERVQEACGLIRIRLKEYNDLFSYNHSFLRRTQGIGSVSRQSVVRAGITGPNLRACGSKFDIRRVHPYSGYDGLDFEVPTTAESSGDAHARFVIRLHEITESLDLLKQASDTLTEGPFSSLRIDREFRLPKGEAYSRIESSRGMLGCHLVSDGGEKPARVSFRAPSSATMAIIPEILKGARLEDVPVILASLDISMAEADR